MRVAKAARYGRQRVEAIEECKGVKEIRQHERVYASVGYAYCRERAAVVSSDGFEIDGV
jgi:hypothetical protein